MYCFCVLVFTLIMIYAIAPKYGRSNPLVYISICSLVGSVSVMAIKGFGIAVKLTIAGNNQFIYVSTYVFGLVVGFCIMIQMNYFNKALDTFSTNVYVCNFALFAVPSLTEPSCGCRVNPLYQVCFSTATIVASIILFQGLNTDNPVNTISLLVGFIIIFIGMHLLDLSRKLGMTGRNNDHHDDATAFEQQHDILNPRLSFQGGRSSIDGWAGASPGLNFEHARRSSRTLGAHSAHAHAHAHAHAPLFDAFDDPLPPPNGSAYHQHALGLRSLREVEVEQDEDEEDEDVEDDELEAATERTRLRAEERRHGGVHRSHSGSPVASAGGGDPRRS